MRSSLLRNKGQLWVAEYRLCLPLFGRHDAWLLICSSEEDEPSEHEDEREINLNWDDYHLPAYLMDPLWPGTNLNSSPTLSDSPFQIVSAFQNPLLGLKRRFLLLFNAPVHPSHVTLIATHNRRTTRIHPSS